jgi:phosphate transport system permease protein
MRASARQLEERVAPALVYLGPTIVASIGAWVLFSVVLGGYRHLSWGFLLEAPAKAGREGGIGPVILSTVLLIGVQTAAVFPIAMGMGIFLAEFTAGRERLGTIVRWSLDIQAGIPSIVFGLFGNAFFCEILGLGFSIVAGGLTLACMVLPIAVRAVDEGLRALPIQHRLSAAALGFSRVAIIFKVLIPAAAPALVTGMVLGTTRALSETAALVFTSGYVARTPTSLLDSGRALSVHILDLSMNVGGADGMAQASSLVLLIMLGVLSLVVGILPRIVGRLRRGSQRTIWSAFYRRERA